MSAAKPHHTRRRSGMSWPRAHRRSANHTPRERRTLSSLLVLTFLSGVLALGLSTVTAAPSQAAPGDPFDPATPTVFVAIDDPTTLMAATTDGSGTTTLTDVGPAADFQYNAIAFNTADNYVYGIAITAGTASDGTPVPALSLIRIGQDGYITRVGTGTVCFCAVGTFGPDGYFYATNPELTDVTVVDVTTGAVVDTVPLSQTLGDAGGGVDLAESGGFFWTLGQDALVRVDLTTGAVTSFPLGSVPCGTLTAGAAWTYGNGNLGFLCNSTGNIVQIAVANASSATPTITVVAVGDGPPTPNVDATAAPGLPADLEIVKDGPATFDRGDTISYTLTVTNNGAGVSSGFVVSDSIPASLSNVSSADAGCTVSGNDVTCISGTLAVGSTQSFTITADTPAAVRGCKTNTATVLGNEADPAASNNTSSVTSCPVRKFNLALDKRAISGPLATVGDNVRYRLQVSNKGPDAAPSPMIKLTDRLPDGLELRSARGKGWNCEVDKAKDKVTCKRNRKLGADRKAAPVFVVAKTTRAALGRVVNTAALDCEGDTRCANNRDQAGVSVVRVPPPPSTGFRW